MHRDRDLCSLYFVSEESEYRETQTSHISCQSLTVCVSRFLKSTLQPAEEECFVLADFAAFNQIHKWLHRQLCEQFTRITIQSFTKAIQHWSYVPVFRYIHYLPSVVLLNGIWKLLLDGKFQLVSHFLCFPPAEETSLNLQVFFIFAWCACMWTDLAGSREGQPAGQFCLVWFWMKFTISCLTVWISRSAPNGRQNKSELNQQEINKSNIN